MSIRYGMLAKAYSFRRFCGNGCEQNIQELYTAFLCCPMTHRTLLQNTIVTNVLQGYVVYDMHVLSLCLNIVFSLRAIKDAFVEFPLQAAVGGLHL